MSTFDLPLQKKTKLIFLTLSDNTFCLDYAGHQIENKYYALGKFNFHSVLNK